MEAGDLGARRADAESAAAPTQSSARMTVRYAKRGPRPRVVPLDDALEVQRLLLVGEQFVVVETSRNYPWSRPRNVAPPRSPGRGPPMPERQLAREWLHHHDAAYSGPVWLRLVPDADRAGDTQRMTVLWGKWELHQSWRNDDGAARTFVHAKARDTDNVRIQVLVDPPAYVEFGTGAPPAGSTTETAGLWSVRDASSSATRATSGDARDDTSASDLSRRPSGPRAAAVDLFISHATEDKAAVARPLVEVLRRRGRSVWYDEFELTLGDSLRRSIDVGLAAARYGVVILSHSFFAKEWPQRELDGLAARETADGVKVILPVWHGIGLADVRRYSPLLAGRLAVRSDTGIDAVADEIERVLNADTGATRAATTSAPPAATSGDDLLTGVAEQPVILHEHLPALVGAHARIVELTFKTAAAGVQTLFDAGEPRTGEKFRIALADAAGAPQATARGPGLYVQLWDADLYVVHPGLSDGRWHHIAVAVDRQTAAITVDDQPVRAQIWDGANYTPPIAAPYPLPLTPATAATAVLIGAGQADGSRWARPFEGAIASLRIRPTASPLIR